MQEHFKYHKRFGREIEKMPFERDTQEQLKISIFFIIFTTENITRKFSLKKEQIFDVRNNDNNCYYLEN